MRTTGTCQFPDPDSHRCDLDIRNRILIHIRIEVQLSTRSRKTRELPMEREKDRFRAEDFRQGLEVLDNEMGKDDWLIAFAPITLISTGGFLATNFFRNRESTGDIDYLLEPQWAHDNDIKKPLQNAITRAARHLGFVDDWVNEELAFFVPDQFRQLLFEKAEEQNIVLWQGTHLRVLAVPLEWALERKLRRIHNSRRHTKRISDVADVLAILKHLRTQNDAALDREYIRTLNICSFEIPPDQATMNEIATAYREQYNEEAFS